MVQGCVDEVHDGGSGDADDLADVDFNAIVSAILDDCRPPQVQAPVLTQHHLPITVSKVRCEMPGSKNRSTH